MSAIHFVGGEKGGVGKSLLSRLLSQYFLDRSMPYIGLDADQSHPTLSRYYGDFTAHQPRFFSTDPDHGAGAGDRQNLVIDLPAQNQRFLDLDRGQRPGDVCGYADSVGVLVRGR